MKGGVEQAEHVLRRHDEDSNHVQKHVGVHTKALNGVNIRKT